MHYLCINCNAFIFEGRELNALYNYPYEHSPHWISHWPVRTQVYCEDHLSVGLSKYVLPLGQ
jgi:hypothetical protein